MKREMQNNELQEGIRDIFGSEPNMTSKQKLLGLLSGAAITATTAGGAYAGKQIADVIRDPANNPHLTQPVRRSDGTVFRKRSGRPVTPMDQTYSLTMPAGAVVGMGTGFLGLGLGLGLKNRRRNSNPTSLKEHYKKILTEAISKDPHVDDHFGAIVDHNAGAGIDPTSNANDTIAKAQQIVNAAASGGHHGLSVNSKGQIISTSITKDWVGRGDTVKAEVVRATSKPFASVDGNHHWFRSESNAPEGMSEYHGGRPYEGRIYSPDYEGLRGEDADNDPNPAETASRMGLDASGRKRMGM